MNNDYFTGHLMRGRQGDYLRETERDERAASLHRAEAERDAWTPVGDRTKSAVDLRHSWRRILALFGGIHRPVHGHHA